VATRALTIEQILIQLPETPRRIAALTAGVAPQTLRKSPAPGEWSANEVLAHLRACADVWGTHILAILTEEKPSWRAVNPRSWIQKTDYVELNFGPSLHSFTNQRAKLMTALAPLPRKDWSRGAMVSGGAPPSERSVLYYAERLARHERAHVKQISRIVKTLSSPV
jgi:hypothetical protein